MTPVLVEAEKNISIVMAELRKTAFFFRLVPGLLAIFVLIGCSTTSGVYKKPVTDTPPSYSDKLLDSIFSYEKALDHMDEGRYDEAAVLFQSAIDRLTGLDGREKDIAFIYSEKADCYTKLSRSSSAESNYIKAIAWNPTDTRYSFMLANFYVTLNRNDQALDIYRKILDIDTNSYEALYSIGTIYDMQADTSKAVSTYEQVLRMHPDHSLSAFNIMNMLVRQKKFGMAIEKFDALPPLMKKNNFLQLEYAYCLKKKGKYQKAFAVLSGIEISDQIDPIMILQEQAENSYFLGNGTNTLNFIKKMDEASGTTMLYHSLADEIISVPANYQQTLSVFNQLTSTDGLNLLAHFGKYKILMRMAEKDQAVEELLVMGKIAFSEENISSATQFFNGAKLLNPRSSLPYTLMAILYEDGGNINRSIDEISRGITIHPTSSTLYRYLGSLYEQKGELKNSFIAFEKASKFDDKNVETILKLGYLAAMVNKPMESILYFKKALVIRTNDVSILGLLALSYLNVSRYSNALHYFQLVEEIDPNAEKIRYYLGMCYERIGNVPLAIDNFEKAITVSSNDADSLNYLAYLLADKDIDMEKACDFVSRALVIDPANPVYLDTLGWALFKLKRYDEALKNLKEASRLFTIKKIDEPVVLEHLGDVYYELKDDSQAIRYWRQAANIDKKSMTLQKKIRSFQNKKTANK